MIPTLRSAHNKNNREIFAGQSQRLELFNILNCLAQICFVLQGSVYTLGYVSSSWNGVPRFPRQSLIS